MLTITIFRQMKLGRLSFIYRKIVITCVLRSHSSHCSLNFSALPLILLQSFRHRSWLSSMLCDHQTEILLRMINSMQGCHYFEQQVANQTQRQRLYNIFTIEKTCSCNAFYPLEEHCRGETVKNIVSLSSDIAYESLSTQPVAPKRVSNRMIF